MIQASFRARFLLNYVGGDERRRLGLDGGNRRDEAVAHPGDGLDELWFFRIVAEKMTEFADGGIDAVIGVNKDVAFPELLNNLPPRNQVSLARHQQDKQVERLGFNAQGSSPSEQLKTPAVKFELAELKHRLRHRKLFGTSVKRSIDTV